MSFSFGFSGDDIEEDEEEHDLVKGMEQVEVNDAPLIMPKRHTYMELVSLRQLTLRPNSDWGVMSHDREFREFH